MAIARAILRDAPILILDEPTAALDVEAETEVMRALNQLVAGRTVIMISHRLSTLGNVDEIIVLKDGQIAERGSYTELKKQGGVFAKLLDEQNRYNLERIEDQNRRNLEKVGDQSILRSAYVPLQVGTAYAPQQLPAQQMPISPIQQGWSGAAPMTQTAPVIMDRDPRANGNSQPPVLEQTPPTARIVIEVDGNVVNQRLLNKPIMTIGRLSSNDISVPSQRVSRLHAKILSSNGNWVIEDAESLNGLVYQGQRIDRLILRSGDRIFLSPHIVLQYQTIA